MNNGREVNLVALLLVAVLYLAVVTTLLSTAVRRRMSYRRTIVPGMIINLVFALILLLGALRIPLVYSLPSAAAAALIVPLAARVSLSFAGALRQSLGKSGLSLDSPVSLSDTGGGPGENDRSHSAETVPPDREVSSGPDG